MFSCRIIFRKDIVRKLNLFTTGEIKAALNIVTSLAKKRLSQFEVDKLKNEFIRTTRVSEELASAVMWIAIITVSIRYKINYSKEYSCRELSNSTPSSILSTLLQSDNIEPEAATNSIVFKCKRNMTIRVKVV